MEELSIKEIVSNITDAILNSNYVGKKQLQNIIEPNLRIWLKTKVNRPKDFNALDNQIKHERAQLLKKEIAIKSKIKKIQSRLKRKELEKRFYRNELLKIYGDDGIKSIDKQCELFI